MRALAALLLSGAAFAQTAGPLTFASVLELAPMNDPDVLSAQADAETAARDLGRQRADPLALGIVTLQAGGAVADAQAALESARLASRSEASDLYFGALSADVELEVAEETLALERARLEGTRIRAEAGAATNLERLQAQNSHAEAERALESARQESRLAYRELADALGLSTTELILRGLSPVALDGPTLPTLPSSLSWAQRKNAGVLAARRAIDLAEAQFNATDNAFNARVDIEAAAAEVARAKTDLKTTLQRLELSVRSAYSDLESAARSFQNALATRRAYDAELNAQRARLEAGNISSTAFREAELTGLQHDQTLYSALYGVYQRAFALEQTISGGEASVPSGGLDVESSGVDALSEDEAVDDAPEMDTRESEDSESDAPVETEEPESDAPDIALPETTSPAENQNGAP